MDTTQFVPDTSVSQVSQAPSLSPFAPKQNTPIWKRSGLLFFLVLLEGLLLAGVIGCILWERSTQSSKEVRETTEQETPSLSSPSPAPLRQTTLASALEKCDFLPDTDQLVIFQKDLPIAFTTELQQSYELKEYIFCYPNPMASEFPVPGSQRSIYLTRSVGNGLTAQFFLFHDGSEWFDFGHNVFVTDFDTMPTVTINNNVYGLEVTGYSSSGIQMNVVGLKDLSGSQAHVKVSIPLLLNAPVYIDVIKKYGKENPGSPADYTIEASAYPVFLQEAAELMQSDPKIIEAVATVDVELTGIVEK